MRSSGAEIIAFPKRRRPIEQDAQLVARARRRAWITVCNMPLPTPLGTAPFVGTEPLTIAIWWRLRVHLWTYGPIADEPRHLASAARVSLRVWRSKADEIGHFFHRTAAGSWVDPDLDDARQSALASEERRALQRLYRKAGMVRGRAITAQPKHSCETVRASMQGEFAL